MNGEEYTAEKIKREVLIHTTFTRMLDLADYIEGI